MSENQDTPNNSMDVRAKQRLCYRVVRFPQTCAVAVSPHVISAVRQLSVKSTACNMGLDENCKTYLDKLVAFKPEYGWGWTRLDAPEIPVPAQVYGVPLPFHCRIREFFDVESELRGFVGRVEESEHIYDGLLVSVSTRVIGTFNFTDNLPRCDVQLGADEPSGEFLTFVSGSPIVNGFGVVGASLQHIAERDLKIGFGKNPSSE